MTLRNLPEINALQMPEGYSWEVPSTALARWVEMPQAAVEDAQTITVYDMIGSDPFTGNGFTAKRMNAALRSIGARDVTVKINSPGGDVFEGFAIYNELLQHKAAVNVEVMGIAASAAAYIAMAGDKISVGLGSFMMIHNSWGMVMGNKNDLQSAIDTLDKIDAAQIDIFAARTGLSRVELAKMMDAETFLTATEAVAKGFADTTMEAPKAVKAHAAPAISAKHKLDALLAQSGVSRSERRRMLQEVAGGTHDAAPTVTRDAGLDVDALGHLLKTLRS